MPSFFRAAGAQLEYLGPEPDRWRSRNLKEMDDAWEFDHYIDLENVPEGALDASDRYTFIAALYAAGIQRPQQSVGFLPWRILELYQRLQTEFAIWRNMEDDPDRPFVEARILNDAGILGHYVADAAQPHHTTIHFNGWAEGAPNPRGFTTDRDFHSRFESAFVEAHIHFQDVDAEMAPDPHPVENPREAVWEHVRASNRTVEEQYELESAYGFDPEAPAHPLAREFVIQRLVAGAEMLRALWCKNPLWVGPRLRPLPIGPKWQWRSTAFYGEPKARMREVKDSMTEKESVVALHDLEGMQDDLIKLFNERFDEINKKIGGLRMNLNITPKPVTPKPAPSAAPASRPENAKRKSKKPTKPKKTEAEERIDQIRSEVEKVLERLGQMETEA